jgi:hypothetical protein
MPESNAFGHVVGESVDFDATQRITREYNAAQIAHLAAHEPTYRNSWGEVEPGNRGGIHRGHDLSDVYPVIGRTGVTYVQFDTDSVNTNDLPQPEVAYDTQRAWESDAWWQ